MPVPPKDVSARARRNKAVTRRTLSAVPAGVRRPNLPRLPSGRWHPMAVKWWDELWASPMAAELVRVDARVVLRLAVLENDFWSAETVTGRLAVAGEIRLAQRDFGLTPLDRRRLEWTIEAVDEARDKGRRRVTTAPAQPAPESDPRLALSAV